MYNFLINVLSHKSLQVHSRICINLDQLTWSNAFCQPMKQAHTSSSMFKVCSEIICSIQIASLISLPLLNPNLSFASVSSAFFSILLLIVLATIFAEQIMRLFRYSPHAVRVNGSKRTG